jgi:hypothetical protein
MITFINIILKYFGKVTQILVIFRFRINFSIRNKLAIALTLLSMYDDSGK